MKQSDQHQDSTSQISNGVMLNAYPDSIGKKLSDIVDMLQRPEFRDTFSLFYILPTFFHSDLDRGFSIIDYDINEELVRPDDLDELQALGIRIKLDLVLDKQALLAIMKTSGFHAPEFVATTHYRTAGTTVGATFRASKAADTDRAG